LPCAFIELRPNTTATEVEIRQFCREQMAGYKVPKRVVFGPIPKNATGKIQTIGIDPGKNTLRLVGLDARGGIVLREKVARARIVSRFANVPPCLIGIEAGMGTHYVTRELLAFGHDVRQVPPVYAKPFRQTHKNDFRDAVECMRRPMLNNSNPGQAVYEPALGSGTTLIAAQSCERVCLGVEIDPLFVYLAIRRWQAFTGERAARACDGVLFETLLQQAQPAEEAV
jgi:hypothetical protein